MIHYTYTSRDGDVITGTAQEIIDTVVAWHGSMTLQDNPEPTDSYYDVVKGSLTMEAYEEFYYSKTRLCTTSELADWLARAEDRPVKDVTSNLSVTRKEEESPVESVDNERRWPEYYTLQPTDVII